jgi:hypothetical protein
MLFYTAPFPIGMKRLFRCDAIAAVCEKRCGCAYQGDEDLDLATLALAFYGLMATLIQARGLVTVDDLSRRRRARCGPRKDRTGPSPADPADVATQSGPICARQLTIAEKPPLVHWAALRASIAVPSLRNVMSYRIVNIRLLALAEDVFEKEPEPGWRLLLREDVLNQCENIGNGVQIQYLCELPDVLCVAGPRGERLHREEMFR